MKDTIYRDDALEQMAQAECGSHYADCEKDNCSCSYISRILDIPSAEAENESCGTCKYFETSHREYPCSDCTVGNSHYVSADRPQGEWEDKEVFNETDDSHFVEEWQSARCSVCGKYHTTPYMYYFDNFNFCPNCGARMYKGGDDE